ncbi:MAG: adenosylcobinamide-GDP ribazoletransferase [Acidimicrobiales bacterium]
MNREHVLSRHAANELRGVEASLTFLTRVPLGRRFHATTEDLNRAVTTFPLVGGAVGALSAIVATLLASSLTPLVSAVLGVASSTALTGALHLDGLADTADGRGARTRERALAIMRESTVGAYGVIAITLDLIMRVALLRALTLRHDAIIGATMAGLFSRATPAVLMSFLPYAREGDGLGRSFASTSRVRGASAAVVACVVALVLNDAVAAAAIVAVLLIGLAFATFFRRWLGGVTGDALGAASEVTEIAVLLVALALMSHA